MYESKVDIPHKRLYVTLKERITVDEAKQAVARIVADIEKLPPGFDVITDISEFEPVTKDAAEILFDVPKAFFQRDVGRIIRVVSDNLKATVGKIQFERASRNTGVSALHFKSIEAAERYLDGEES